jgi:penicillin-binding protein 1A
MRLLRRFLDQRSVRRCAVALAALLTLQALAFTLCYTAACQYLREHDPRKVENLIGVSYFARPKLLITGQDITREEIITYLDSIGYQRREGDVPGTFSVARNGALKINSRLPEFPSATILFRRGKIEAITIGDQTTRQVPVEPPSLVNVIRQIKDEQLYFMRARRIVLQEDELMRSQLYAVTLCAEDKRFEDHNGIDERGILSALLIRRKGGGSTLAQQLIKNGVLGDVSSGWSLTGLTRKGKEIFLSLAASRMMTKAEVFTAYANNCPLGGGDMPGTVVLYGFGAASQELFGVEVNQLSLGNAAALGAMIHRPNHYLKAARDGDYSELLARRAANLDAVQQQFAERYTPEMIAQAKAESLEFLFVSEREAEKPLDVISRHFQSLAASQARGLADLKFGQAQSTRVYLTLDPALQAAAYKAVIDHRQHLDRLVADARRKQGLTAASAEQIQMALVAIEVQTGQILALVGSRGEGEFFNYATAKRSPGSAIKPFVYLAALDGGSLRGVPFTAASIIHPLTDAVDNYRSDSHAGEIASARRNLAISANAAACVVGHCAGLARTRDYIERFTSARSNELTGMLTIGGSAGSEVDAVGFTAGYAALASGGLKFSPTTFTSVYEDGREVTLPRSAPVRIADPGPTYIITQMLRSVVQSGGTGHGALAQADLLDSAPIVGKTGTGQVADSWFCGYSPRVAVCAWVGMPKNRPALRMKDGFSAARAAMPVWASFLRNGVKKHRPDLLMGEFSRPDNVKVLHIDPKRGCIRDGSGVEEYFLEGRIAPPCAR